jgi:hypothetical protein
MDAFELSEAKRRLLQKRIIPIWAEFRTSVRSLVASYNCTPKGQSCNAKVELAHDERVLTVTSLKEVADGGLNVITISIRAAVQEGKFLIEATREKWLASRISGVPPIERIEWTEYLFRLEGDLVTGETWLAHKTQRRSAFQCAEFLLFAAFGEDDSLGVTS